jgi:L-asparaginase II
MLAHPDHVSGTQRSDLFFAQAGRGDWIAKAGADGVQAIGIRSLGLGIAVKVSDGHANARHVAAFDVLRQLGLCDGATSGIDRYARMPIRNIAGAVTGWMQPVFAMKAL